MLTLSTLFKYTNLRKNCCLRGSQIVFFSLSSICYFICHFILLEYQKINRNVILFYTIYIFYIIRVYLCSFDYYKCFILQIKLITRLISIYNSFLNLKTKFCWEYLSRKYDIYKGYNIRLILTFFPVTVLTKGMEQFLQNLWGKNLFLSTYIPSSTLVWKNRMD